MAGDGLVKDQIGDIVSAVEIGGAQVDPHPARNLAVLAARAAIGTRRARFLRQGQASHLKNGIDQRVERAGHLRRAPEIGSAPCRESVWQYVDAMTVAVSRKNNNTHYERIHNGITH